MRSWLHRHRTPLLLFLFVLCSYGALINARNMRDFALQQLGVESIVDRGHFYLDGSTAIKMEDDVFAFHGHHYAIKQPGQLLLGSIPYFALHAVGLTYSNNYDLTAALVTWLSSTLIVALGVVFFFLFVKKLWVTMLYAFGTTMFVYAVLPQHDAIAGSLALIAFYLASRSEHRAKHSLVAGILLGVTVTTSMLALWVALPVGIYLLTRSGLRRAALAIIGAIIGLLPLFYYDYVNFGDPFLFPNIAANASDTFLSFHLFYSLYKAAILAKWSLLYTPIAVVGAVGLLKMPRSMRREQLVCLASIILTVLYLLNIDTMGGWQYGPRYLLPVMPFAMIGLAFIPTSWQLTAKIIGAYSTFASLVGVIGGAMDEGRGYITWTYIQRFATSGIPSFPLFILIIVPIAIAAITLRSRTRIAKKDA